MNGRDLTLTALSALFVATEIVARAGSPAVDWRKRRADLERMAAPRSGATPNERAMAKKFLRQMADESEPDPPRSTFHHAGHSARHQVPPWQTDPRSQSDIFQNSFRDLNFTKKMIYEHAASPRSANPHVHVSLHAFDGAFGRSALEVFTSEDDLAFAGMAFEAWSDPFFKTDGHVEAVIAVHAESSHLSQVIRIRGVDVSNANGGKGIWIGDDSFNKNPFNDSSFARRLRDLIDP